MNFYTTFLIVLIFFGILVYIISLVENKFKAKELYIDNAKHSILFALLSIIISVVIAINLDDNEMFIYAKYLLLIIKFIVAFIIGREADKLGRNKFLWGTLGFLEYHTVLLVLGTGYKLLKLDKPLKKNVEEINNQTLKKEKMIVNLYNEGILDSFQKKEKIEDLKDKYSDRLDTLIDDYYVKEYQQRLDHALKNGLINQEEYDKAKE